MHELSCRWWQRYCDTEYGDAGKWRRLHGRDRHHINGYRKQWVLDLH